MIRALSWSLYPGNSTITLIGRLARWVWGILLRSSDGGSRWFVCSLDAGEKRWAVGFSSSAIKSDEGCSNNLIGMFFFTALTAGFKKSCHINGRYRSTKVFVQSTSDQHTIIRKLSINTVYRIHWHSGNDTSMINTPVRILVDHSTSTLSDCLVR